MCSPNTKRIVPFCYITVSMYVVEPRNWFATASTNKISVTQKFHAKVATLR